MNKTIIILHNKISNTSNTDELDVLHQVELVKKAYSQLGFEAIPMELGDDPYKDIQAIKKINPLHVFNLVEAIYNKGELIYFGPALLNSFNIKYTGVPLESLFLTTSKVLAKKIMAFNRIPTAVYYSPKEIDQLISGKKYIVKPIWEEGSVGLDEDAVFEPNDKEKIDQIKKLSPTHFFIEEYLSGREFNVSILGGNGIIEVLHPAEMIYKDFPDGKPKILGYRAKWDENTIEYKNTSRSFETLHPDSSLCKKIKEICINSWNSFNLKGYARVDFRLDENENPFVLEINGNPCISPDSGFISAALHAGYTPLDVVKRISEELN